MSTGYARRNFTQMTFSGAQTDEEVYFASDEIAITEIIVSKATTVSVTISVDGDGNDPYYALADMIVLPTGNLGMVISFNHPFVTEAVYLTSSGSCDITLVYHGS